MPLWKLILSWKGFVATRALALLRVAPRPERRTPTRRESESPDGTRPDRSPALQGFWQNEYGDTCMRNEEQGRKAIRYIEDDPARAKLVLDPAAWPFSCARFRDEQTRDLRLPAANKTGSSPADGSP
jgi:hypothetical protein